MTSGARRKEPMRKNVSKGLSTVEFAVLAPVVMLLFVGAADLARAFYHAIVMSGAAAGGSFYGAQNTLHSGEFTEMESRTSSDAADLRVSVTATASRKCECPPSGGGSPTEVDCLSGTCPGYGLPRLYVSTQARQTFDLILPWPGVPDNFGINRNVWLRVQ